MEKIKKVFSPGKDKDDEIMYGTPSKESTSTTDPAQASPSSTLQTDPDAGQKDKGVLRQVFNPGGDKYSEQSYGKTATSSEPAMADKLQKEPASTEPLKGTETAQHNNDTVQQEPIDSTSGGTRSATTAGPSTMAREDNQDDVSGATYTARSYALGGGSSQRTSEHADQTARDTSALGSSSEQPPQENAGRRLDHSLAGAGTGGAGAGYVGADELNEFMKHGRDQEADDATYRARDHYLGSSADADPFQRPGHELYSADKGPSNVESAGEMAPGHIPGEFPSDDGDEPHNRSSGIGAGTAAGLGAGAGAGAAGIAASTAYNDRNTAGSTGQSSRGDPSSPIQTTTNTMRSGSFSKPSQESKSESKPEEEKEKSGGFKGALAAATAAMGLGGAGAYAASKDDDKDDSSKAKEAAQTATSSREPQSSNVAPGSVVSEKTQAYTHHRPGDSSTSQTESSPAASRPTQTQEQDDESHTARNAALGAGTVGAAGAGAYALTRDDDSQQPQSVVSDKTQSYVRSHPSDRDPNLQSSGTSAPTSQTQPANPSTASREDDSNAGRNAALGAGAAGAAGAGGAYASSGRDDKPTATAGSVVSPETQKYYGSHPSDNNSAYQGNTSTTGPSTQSRSADAGQQEEDHTLRNTALGAGAAGAAGAGGAYALSGRDDKPTATAGSVVSPETQKYYGSHPSDNNSAYQGTSTTGPSSQSQPPSSTQQQSDDTARNAALGAGAAGAAGAGGAYALSGRDDNQGGATSGSVVSPETQKYTGKHPSDSNRDLQGGATTGSYGQSQTTSQPQQEEDHTGRNALLGAGAAGAAGAGGAYALSGRDDNQGGATSGSVVSPETQKYTGKHPSDSNRDLQGPATTSSSYGSSQPGSQPQQEESHTGRNAALGAGAVGAAGAGAYTYSQRDQEQDPAAAQAAAAPQAQKYSEPKAEEPKRSKPEEPKRTTQTTTTTTKPSEQPRETKPAAQPEPTSRAQQPEEEDNTMRNAALGAGGVGAAGAGAYYLTRGEPAGDQGQQASSMYPSDQPLTRNREATVPQMSSQAAPAGRQDDMTTEMTFLGAGTAGAGAGGAGAHGASRAGDSTGPASKTSEPTKSQEQDQGHNYGRDAAVVGGTGAAGAAGYGAYQYANRDEPAASQQEYAQQQQYPPQQQQQQQQQYAQPQEKYKESTPQPSTPERDPRVASGSDGHNKLHKKAVDPAEQEESNTGRNAALGVGAAGATGAAGYGAKEYYDNQSEGRASGDGSERSGEKKHGFMHKILHPREHKREKEEEERRRSGDTRGSYDSPRATTDAQRSSPAAGAAASPTVATGPRGGEEGGMVTEPHTGLPMNVGKYGPGAGGTDGAGPIEGYHGDGTDGGRLASGVEGSQAIGGAQQSGQSGRPF